MYYASETDVFRSTNKLSFHSFNFLLDLELAGYLLSWYRVSFWTQKGYERATYPYICMYILCVSLWPLIYIHRLVVLSPLSCLVSLAFLHFMHMPWQSRFRPFQRAFICFDCYVKALVATMATTAAKATIYFACYSNNLSA